MRDGYNITYTTAVARNGISPADNGRRLPRFITLLRTSTLSYGVRLSLTRASRHDLTKRVDYVIFQL